jgi:chemotaxis protein methyltransferase CheR
MRHEVIDETLMPRLSDLVTERFGLQFPRNRWSDLQRGLEEASNDLGVTDLSVVADILAGTATKPQLDAIASRLTVGETYFFREPASLDFLERTILPELLRSRRQTGKRLRIWSAACCTGEEAYSIAILLRRVIPDLTDWQVTILATDVNPVFLEKAVAGVYSEWSFRGAPEWLQLDYFKRAGNGRHEIHEGVKRQVSFSQLNLVTDMVPSLALSTNAFDLILCRNVLMYFSPSQAEKVVKNFERALVTDGWLIVSPTEASHRIFSSFTHDKDYAVPCYRKTPVQKLPTRFEPAPPVITFEPPQIFEAQIIGESVIEGPPENGPEYCAQMARVKANEGALDQAQTWCERWIAADKLSAAAYYLSAVILQELGDVERARIQLQRAVYLDPNFVLAHFGLGKLARDLGRDGEASKHFNNALQYLQSLPQDEELPESDGLTAGRLSEMISSINLATDEHG